MALRRIDSPAAEAHKPPAGAKSDHAPELVSVEQAVRLAGVSRRTIYNWIAKGIVRTQRVASGRIRIETASLFKGAA